MTDSNLRAEIEALRREIDAVRVQHGSMNTDSETKPHPSSDQSATNLADQLSDLASEISTFAEDPEQGVMNHPLTSVLGALVLGILIGRTIHR